jgi:hypothetical protein
VLEYDINRICLKSAIFGITLFLCGSVRIKYLECLQGRLQDMGTNVVHAELAKCFPSIPTEIRVSVISRNSGNLDAAISELLTLNRDRVTVDRRNARSNDQPLDNAKRGKEDDVFFQQHQLDEIFLAQVADDELKGKVRMLRLRLRSEWPEGRPKPRAERLAAALVHTCCNVRGAKEIVLSGAAGASHLPVD